MSRGYSAVAAILAFVLVPIAGAQGATKPPRPDLVVSSVSNPPATSTPGTTFSSTAKIRNRGKATAGASTTRFFMSMNATVNRGDLRVGEQRLSRLRAGKSVSRRTTLKVPTFAHAGIYRLIVCADRRSQIRESNERNNCRTAVGRIRVVKTALNGPGTGSPNAALAISPADRAFGAAVGASHGPVKFTVTNNGQSASGNLVTAMTGADETMFKISSDACAGKSLPTGASCTLEVTFTPTSLGAKTAALHVAGTPGGLAIANLTGTGQTPAALGMSPANHAFASTAIGSSSSATTLTVTNNGQAVSGTLSAALAGTDASHFKISQNNCAGVTLIGGASCTVIVTFSPTGTGGKAASLNVSAAPGGTASSALTGTGLTPASVSVSPTNQPFGASSVGSQGSTFQFTVTNSGQETSGTVTTTVAGTHASQFVISGDTCEGTTLTQNQQCTLNVTFIPTGSPGNREASLQIAASPGTPAGSPATSLLTGTATSPALVISPNNQNFGIINVGSASTFPFTVSNTGLVQTGALATSITGADSSQFSITTNNCQGMQLAASTGSCTLQVTFSPTSAGVKQATLQVSGAPGGTATAALTGTGSGLSAAVLTLTPVSQFFGSVQAGQTSGTFQFTVQNTGQSPSSTITASVTGSNPTNFVIGTNTCTGTLAPNATCTINVTFAPPGNGGTGSRSATLQVTAMQGGTDTSALTGTAT